MLQDLIHDSDITATVWSAGRELSRLLFAADRCILPFIRSPHCAPINRLPPDILTEIFMNCLCHDGFRPLSERGRLLVEPLTLSHVSSRWRRVAMSSGALWASIWVDRPREAHIPMVELWLERSRQCPLVLYLRQTQALSPGQPFTDPREYDLTENILRRLKKHLHRWKRVTFFLYGHAALRALLHLPEVPTAAPLLEHIHMTASEWDDDSKLRVERVMHSYPALTSLVVHQDMMQNFVPWARLTILDASQLGCPLSSHVAVLKLCTSLRRAEFSIVQDLSAASFIRPTHRVRVPHLSSLTVHADRVDLAPLFECLILPALEGLVLRYTRALRREDDAQALHNLLLRSGCMLQRFSLRDHPRARDDAPYLAFLRSRQMAALQELYMQVDLTDNLVRFLTLGDAAEGTPRHLPQLQLISLRDVEGEHIDDLELYRLVVSRLGAGPAGTRSAPLRRAYFHLRVRGHSASPVLPLLFERCRDRLELRVYLAHCEDPSVMVGWYTSAPIPGGYLMDG
ncbi:hypothetical protein GGX14DRAFT_393293 [Mycena pura]|uniref:F-box domain-containing protein n=1 Tax=Mycena pura TaxID=153505 RepID=A0AAD6VHN7_9AGAR|nr:hypothetical protein GGX14DRAFT_393293 [Mycena pura]